MSIFLRMKSDPFPPRNHNTLAKRILLSAAILLSSRSGSAQTAPESTLPQAAQEQPRRWRLRLRINPVSRLARVVGLSEIGVFAFGGEGSIISPYSIFISASVHAVWTRNPGFDSTLSAGYIFNDRGSGWHIAFPVELGYRHITWANAGDYGSGHVLDIVFAGGRVALTRLWTNLGFEIGVMLNVGLPVRSRASFPAFPRYGEAQLWLDGGIFLGGFLAP